MASTSDQISALQKDGSFQIRVMALAIQYAIGTVFVEDPATPNHSLRLAFARSVINGGGSNIVLSIANSTNIIGSNITYNFADGHIVTDATDSAISSQISTYWNMLSGV